MLALIGRAQSHNPGVESWKKDNQYVDGWKLPCIFFLSFWFHFLDAEIHLKHSKRSKLDCLIDSRIIKPQTVVWKNRIVFSSYSGGLQHSAKSVRPFALINFYGNFVENFVEIFADGLLLLIYYKSSPLRGPFLAPAEGCIIGALRAHPKDLRDLMNLDIYILIRFLLNRR